MNNNPKPVLLWPEQQREALNERDNVDENGWYHNVVIPRLFPFLPPVEKGNGGCILICPGGAYRILDWVAHVERLAARFNPLGYAVVGLKYRTAVPNTDIPEKALADLRQALELIEEYADVWNINKQKIIGLGYSAGSNLLLNHVCTPISENTTVNLCGVALMCMWPNEKMDSDYTPLPDVPRAFVCTTAEDRTAPESFSRAISARMEKAGIEVTTHIYPKGDHIAFNFREDGPEVDWTPPFMKWLEKNCK